MPNAVPLRAAAWTISAAVWGVLVIGAFSMSMKLPVITLPTLPNDPITVRTEPAPPPVTAKTIPPSLVRPADDPDPTVVVLTPFPTIDPGPNLSTATVGTVSGPLVAGPPRITNPHWLSRPGAREFERFYPPRARDREKEGRVTLDCIVAANGAIACTVMNESPAGWGFGDAALKIAPSFRLAPRLEDGRPTEGGAVRVDIAFRLDR